MLFPLTEITDWLIIVSSGTFWHWFYFWQTAGRTAVHRFSAGIFVTVFTTTRFETLKLSVKSDKALPVFEPRQMQRCMYLPKRPDWLWGLRNFQFNDYWGSVLGAKRPEVKLITHLHLVPRLSISGAIPHYFHTPSWRRQPQLYLLPSLCPSSVILS